MTETLDALIPPNEGERIAAVRRYDILDTPPDGAFDRITAIAARMFDVPIAIVSVVDTDRIWFKSHHGLPDVSQIDREPGLCASAILQGAPWIVTDAANDPRTLANPLVASDFGLRFYAGVPLATQDGYNLGTLCVLDHEPREVTDAEMANLADLAALVMNELELRLVARSTIATEGRLRREAEEMAEALQASLLPPRTPEVPGVQLATRYLAGELGLRVGGDFFDVFRAGDSEWGIVLGDACGKGARPASLAALARWSVRAASVHHRDPSQILRAVNDVLRAEDDSHRDDHFCTAVLVRLRVADGATSASIASAGHPLPVVLRASGEAEVAGNSAVPLGLFDSIEPGTVEVDLGPGDALVLYTDGITEARDLSGEPLGEARLLDALRPLVAASAQEIANAVVSAAQQFGNRGLTDDVGVVVLKVPTS